MRDPRCLGLGDSYDLGDRVAAVGEGDPVAPLRPTNELAELRFGLADTDRFWPTS